MAMFMYYLVRYSISEPETWKMESVTKWDDTKKFGTFIKKQ